MLTFGVPNLCQSQQVFPDNFMRREILSLVVQCIYIELGCKWKGEVRHLEVQYSCFICSLWELAGKN